MITRAVFLALLGVAINIISIIFIVRWRRKLQLRNETKEIEIKQQLSSITDVILKERIGEGI